MSTNSTREKLLIAGLGGGGVVTMGDLLAKAALFQYPHVTWYPCYNTLMRGGDSECCILLSDRAIPSPAVYKCKTVLLMPGTQIASFEKRVEPNGLLIVGAEGPTDENPTTRDDIQIRYVPARETARELGNPRNANLIMMGAYIGLTKAISPRLVEAEIEKSLKLKGLDPSEGKQAFTKGIELATE